ncbi:MAG: hypothetical protein J2P17_26545, partial [Mycobacterium sp.]|nr:hypothetical protein [Mycobacterium sp.]
MLTGRPTDKRKRDNQTQENVPADNTDDTDVGGGDCLAQALSALGLLGVGERRWSSIPAGSSDWRALRDGVGAVSELLEVGSDGGVRSVAEAAIAPILGDHQGSNSIGESGSGRVLAVLVVDTGERDNHAVVLAKVRGHIVVFDPRAREWLRAKYPEVGFSSAPAGSGRVALPMEYETWLDVQRYGGVEKAWVAYFGHDGGDGRRLSAIRVGDECPDDQMPDKPIRTAERRDGDGASDSGDSRSHADVPAGSYTHNWSMPSMSLLDAFRKALEGTEPTVLMHVEHFHGRLSVTHSTRLQKGEWTGPLGDGSIAVMLQLDEDRAVWLRADSADGLHVNGVPVDARRVRVCDGDVVTWDGGHTGVVRFSRTLHPADAENGFDPSQQASIWNMPPWDDLEFESLPESTYAFLVRYQDTPFGVYKIGLTNDSIRDEIAAWCYDWLAFSETDGDDESSETGLRTVVPPTRAWLGPAGMGMLQQYHPNAQTLAEYHQENKAVFSRSIGGQRIAAGHQIVLPPDVHSSNVFVEPVASVDHAAVRSTYGRQGIVPSPWQYPNFRSDLVDANLDRPLDHRVLRMLLKDPEPLRDLARVLRYSAAAGYCAALRLQQMRSRGRITGRMWTRSIIGDDAARSTRGEGADVADPSVGSFTDVNSLQSALQELSADR